MEKGNFHLYFSCENTWQFCCHFCQCTCLSPFSFSLLGPSQVSCQITTTQQRPGHSTISTFGCHKPQFAGEKKKNPHHCHKCLAAQNTKASSAPNKRQIAKHAKTVQEFAWWCNLCKGPHFVFMARLLQPIQVARTKISFLQKRKKLPHCLQKYFCLHFLSSDRVFG